MGMPDPIANIPVGWTVHMSDITDKLTRLRELFPDGIEKIEAEERRIRDLLKRQEYYTLPATQELLSSCRKAILEARMKLATERTLEEQARAELWHIIDAREWVLKMVARDYKQELAEHTI